MGKKSEVGGAECCHALLFCQETQCYYVTIEFLNPDINTVTVTNSEKSGNLIFFSIVCTYFVELPWSDIKNPF